MPFMSYTIAYLLVIVVALSGCSSALPHQLPFQASMRRCSMNVLPLLLLLVGVFPLQTRAADGVTGGWRPAEISQNATTLLDTALQNETSYRDTVTARVCVLEIRSLSQQVVAGMNYAYAVQACPVTTTKSAGMCAVKTLTTNASCADYTIRIFEQVWTDTVEVTSIELSKQDESSGGSESTDDSSESGSSSIDTPAGSPGSDAGTSKSSDRSDSLLTPPPASTTTASPAVRVSSVHVVVAAVSLCVSINFQ